MSMIGIVTVLFGMALGQRFKVLILAPALLLTCLLVAAIEIERADPPWTIGLTEAATILCLQIGYLAGICIRQMLLAARASRAYALTSAKSPPGR
jgi:hypothetical protein